MTTYVCKYTRKQNLDKKVTQSYASDFLFFFFGGDSTSAGVVAAAFSAFFLAFFSSFVSYMIFLSVNMNQTQSL